MANDLDRLFRENLDQYEVTPKASSWEQVHGQITPKKSYWILPRAIAATIALLVTVGWILWSGDNQNGEISSEVAIISHPVMETFQWDLEIQEVAIKEVQMIAEVVKEPVHEKTSIVTLLPERLTYDPYRTLAILNPDLETSIPVNYEIAELKGQRNEKPSVRITYIASNSNEKITGKIGSFLNYLSEEVDPTEILADIRDAKDQILSRN